MLEPPLLLTFGVSQALGLLAVVFVTWASVIDNDKTVVVPGVDKAAYRFVWHPVLMSVGMGYLFGCSAVLFRVLRNMDKFHAKLLHMVINGIAVASTLVGFVFAVQMYNVFNSKHFQTVHGLFGLITVILFCTQWVISIPVFLWPKAPATIRAPGIYVHVCVGVAVFVCASVCNLTGLNERKGETDTSQTYYKVSAFFHLAYTLVILYTVTLKQYKRPPDY